MRQNGFVPAMSLREKLIITVALFWLLFWFALLFGAGVELLLGVRNGLPVSGLVMGWFLYDLHNWWRTH